MVTQAMLVNFTFDYGHDGVLRIFVFKVFCQFFLGSESLGLPVYVEGAQLM